MNKRYISVCAVAALLATGTSVQAAEGFYYGVGLGFATMDSDASGVGPTSESDSAVLGLTLGYRWEAGATFYGAELDADISGGADFDDSITSLPCATAASGPYWCSHDATVRLRGLVGQSMASGLEVFGTLGFVAAFGESAIGPATQASVTNTGFTVGIGLQRPLGAGTGRIELIYDNAENSDNPGGFDPSYEAVTLKATFLF